MSHNIIAQTSAFFLSHKLAVVNLFQQSRMVGIRHSVATATAFLKTTLPVKEGRFRFISHKFTASNLRYQARRMNNRSYVTEQTTALHLIYQKFNYLRRKLKSPSLWQGTVLIVALATIVCRVSAANRTRIENTPTAVPKSRQLPWYTLYIHCTYTYEFCRYRQN